MRRIHLGDYKMTIVHRSNQLTSYAAYIVSVWSTDDRLRLRTKITLFTSEEIKSVPQILCDRRTPNNDKYDIRNSLAIYN